MVLLLLAFPVLALGQVASVPVSLTSSSGGGVSTSATFRLAGSIGVDTGGFARGSDFIIGVGFWFATQQELSVALDGEGEFDIPDTYQLDQNYPNPFNPSTVIRFGLPEPGPVRVVVYNLLGREVAVLTDGQMRAGWHSVTWDAIDAASGLYLYRLEAPDYGETKRMILVK
ncbi:MAG: T9SS type A sorting domain-containing protein [Bacteroidota bacterium]